MADTGAPWNIPYVENADLVKDYPTASLALANAIADGLDAAGYVKQIVRATDTTDRSTTSTTFVDVTGMSVTITPTDATSRLFIVATGNYHVYWEAELFQEGYLQIADSSNVALAGAESVKFGRTRGSTGSAGAPRSFYAGFCVIGYIEPTTTSAVTYKLRHRVHTSSSAMISFVRNAETTGQMLAIEVAA